MHVNRNHNLAERMSYYTEFVGKFGETIQIGMGKYKTVFFSSTEAN